MGINVTDTAGGKPIFAQWDVDRELIITGATETPQLRFAHPMLKRAIVVVSEEVEGETPSWTCKVPNFVLQFDGPLVVSVFEQEDGGEGKETALLKYLIRPRMKPQDYTYEENIGYVNWVQMSEEARELLDAVGNWQETLQATGTELLESIEESGEGYLASVQEKGEEVLESIPEDYSELSSDVVDLKSATNAFGLDSIAAHLSDETLQFEHGNIVNGADSTVDAVKCLRTQGKLRFDKGFTISAKNGDEYARVNVALYRTNGDYATSTGWVTSYTIPAGVTFRIVLCAEYGSGAPEKRTMNDILPHFDCAFINNPSGLTFEYGSLNPQGGDAQGYAVARIRTVGPVSLNEPFTFKCSGGKFTINFYDSDGTLINSSGWKYAGEEFTVLQGMRIRLLIARDPDQTTAGDAAQIVGYVAIEKTSNTYTDTDSPLTAFENGSIAPDGSNTTDRQFARLRTPSIADIDKHTTVKWKSGQFIVVYYDAEGAKLNATSWLTSDFTITARSRVRLIITADNASSAVFDTKTIMDCIDIAPYDADFGLDGEITDFVCGSLNDTGGNTDSKMVARIRTKEVVSCPNYLTITRETGRFLVNFYKADDSLDKSTGWRSEDITIPPNRKFRLIVTTDEATSAIVNGSDLLSCVKFAISPMSYSKVPNVIFQSRNVDRSSIPPMGRYYVQAAAYNQYDRVRINLRKTSDGHFVCVHDATINYEARNPDGTEISESVSSSSTLETLNSYDWGIKYGAYYAGMKVPTLEETCEFAMLYNMGLTIETHGNWTQQNISDACAILSKYGMLKNLLVTPADNTKWTERSYWQACSPLISFYFGDIESWFEDANNVSAIHALETGKNKIYCQMYPWLDYPTETFRELVAREGWEMYASMAHSFGELFTGYGFGDGNTIIETADTYMIKDMLRAYADNAVIDWTV